MQTAKCKLALFSSCASPGPLLTFHFKGSTHLISCCLSFSTKSLCESRWWIDLFCTRQPQPAFASVKASFSFFQEMLAKSWIVLCPDGTKSSANNWCLLTNCLEAFRQMKSKDTNGTFFLCLRNLGKVSGGCCAHDGRILRILNTEKLPVALCSPQPKLPFLLKIVWLCLSLRKCSYSFCVWKEESWNDTANWRRYLWTEPVESKINRVGGCIHRIMSIHAANESPQNFFPCRFSRWANVLRNSNLCLKL